MMTEIGDSPPTPGMASVRDGDIIKAFQTINEDLQAKNDLIDKCLSMCHQFSVSAKDLAYEWEAHALNAPPGSGNSVVDSSQAMLTLSSLEALEAALIKKKAATAHANSLSTRKVTTPYPSRQAPAFSSSSVPTSEKELRKRLSMDGAASGGLMSPPPLDHKRGAPPSFLSPTEPAKMARAGISDVSPATMQSPPEPGSSYKSRANAGQRASELNSKLGARASFTPSKRRGGSRCELTFLEEGQDINVTTRYRYMYTALEERARALERILVGLQKDMVERANLGGMDPAPVGVPRQESVLVIGRVCCEAAEGKLNKSSVMLEGSRRDSGGFRVKLELNELQGFAFFPGQIIAVEGINSSGFKMVVRRACEGIPRPLMQTRISKLKQYHHDQLYQGGDALSLMVAAGPYTTVDSLDYQPLEDLLRVVAAKKPDVLVLAGPFVDATHPSIASGEAEVAGGEDEEGGVAGFSAMPSYETVDYEALFKMRVSYFLDGLFASNPGLPTKVVLVPALTDVFHDDVFPQPPLADRIAGGVSSPFFEEERIGNLDIPYSQPGSDQRVWCLSNPAMFRVNEVTIGITTNDILLHLSGEEVSQGNAMNRLSRLAGHLIQQQSFYPLFPPPADGAAQLDLRHADHWKMPVTPDVLLLPSKLHHFVKEVGGCLCLNPGPLAKGAVGGTYACLDVHPLPAEDLEQMDVDEGTLEHKVAARTAVEIIKV